MNHNEKSICDCVSDHHDAERGAGMLRQKGNAAGKVDGGYAATAEKRINKTNRKRKHIIKTQTTGRLRLRVTQRPGSA